LLVLPETAGPVDALVTRLRSAIENWNRKNFPEIPITIDIGWATWTPEKPRSVPELLAEADARLYEEKRKSLVEPS
jgi:GGDEF domain-containing protein